MASTQRRRPGWWALVTGIALVLVGGGFAALANTDLGRVAVRDVRFVGDGGHVISGLLYVPRGASADRPAPGVLAVHGYVNSRETMSPVSIELARRGHVVLDVDQTGHGGSDAPAFADGYGGPAALRHLRSLDIVDTDHIGLVGHSMGGWAVLQAARSDPDGYSSLVLMSSAPFPAGPSTGGNVSRTPEGTTTFPRNTAVIVSTVEEFSTTMWREENPADIKDAPSLRKLFGTDTTVRTDEVYGSIADGTGRVFHQPVNVHPGVTHDPVAVGQVVDWFGRTLTGGTPATGQVWWVKELGTLLALLGGLVALFGTARLLSRRDEPLAGVTADRWWWGALPATVLPAVTFIPVMKYAPRLLPNSAWFSQSVSNWIVVWALVNALVTAVLLKVWKLEELRTGLRRAWVVGGAAVGVLLLLDVVSGWVFGTDLRFWVFAFRVPTALQLTTALCYLPPLLVFFVVFSAMLNTRLRLASRRAAYAAAALVPSAGLAVLVLVQYARFPFGGTLVFPGYQLHTVVAYQVVALMAVAGVLCVALFRWTGSVYPGAVAAALLASWNLAAGTATQSGVDEWDPLRWTLRVVLPLVVGVGLLVAAARARRSARVA